MADEGPSFVVRSRTALRAMRERAEPYAPTFRRVFHLASPLFLLYYLVPSDAWTGGVISRQLALLVVLLAFLLAEGIRLILRIPVFGLREYEGRQISAFTWAAMALTVAFLLFPAGMVIPAMLGFAWIDPLCAHTRRHGLAYPWVPFVAYALLIGSTLAFEGMYGLLVLSPWNSLPLALAAAGVAIAVEAPRWPEVDDDFRMMVMPLVTLWGVNWLLQHL